MGANLVAPPDGGKRFVRRGPEFESVDRRRRAELQSDMARFGRLNVPALLGVSTRRLLLWQLVWLAPVLFGLSVLFGKVDADAGRAFYSAAGGPDPLWTVGIFNVVDGMIGLISVWGLAVGLFLGCFRRTRFAGFIVLLGALAYLGGCASRRSLFGAPRKEAFTQLGERLMPLVDAIEAYHDDRGAYPEALESLVPGYLTKIPATEMGNFTNFHYYVGPRARSYYGNPWVLVVPAHQGMGFSEFHYFPLQNYPTNGAHFRVGKWAYCQD